MFRYVGLIGAALAVLAYIFLQSTPVNFHIKKFISHEPVLVFSILKDPAYLTELHPKVRNVYVESFKVDDSNVEHREFIVTEDVAHIGLHNLSAVSVSDPNSLEISTKAVLLHGLVYVDMVYKLTESWNGTVAGTMVEEMTTMHFPYVLVSFANRTAVEIHSQVLNNLEMLMEFTAGSETEDIIVDVR